MAVLECVAAMEIISKDSAKTKISHLRKVTFNDCLRNLLTPELTFSIPPVYVILWKFLQIVFEQHLVARNPLHRLQHVMLQSQIPTHVLTLKTHSKTIYSFLEVMVMNAPECNTCVGTVQDILYIAYSFLKLVCVH